MGLLQRMVLCWITMRGIGPPVPRRFRCTSDQADMMARAEALPPKRVWRWLMFGAIGAERRTASVPQDSTLSSIARVSGICS